MVFKWYCAFPFVCRFNDLLIITDWFGSFLHGVSCTDSVCLVFTEYHVKDTNPCYLIYTKIRESTPQRLELPGTLGKAS